MQLEDVLAEHLARALEHVAVLNDCIDLLAQHLQGALDRLAILERLAQRHGGAEVILPTTAPPASVAIPPPEPTVAPSAPISIEAAQARRAERQCRFSDTRSRIEALLERAAAR